MDKEQARFVLRSYRPCGADSNDSDFTAALRVAHDDPELGQWLAEARAFDTGFAGALNRLSMPACLRDNILRQLAIERGDLPALESRGDEAFATALASIPAPDGLRVEILATMDRAARDRRRGIWWRRAMIPAAAAAGIALALFVSRSVVAPPIAIVPKLPIDVVETEFIRTFESPDFTLDEKRPDQLALLQHLKERKLPCPCCLPPGLAHLEGIGCRELVIDGRVGSIICFKENDNGIVHLVVFRRKDVDAGIPSDASPEVCSRGKWTLARWADADRVFVLFGDHTEPSKLAALF